MKQARNEVLLTVSGVIDADIEGKIQRGERPRADYLAMERAFPADLIDFAAARRQAGRIGGLLERLGGPNLVLAWACFQLRRRYRVIFTDGEQVGILLAMLLKLAGRSRPCHLMIAHLLSVRKKMIFFDWLKVQHQIDTFFVYSTWQKAFIETRWKIPGGRVVFTPFMVDARFFSPDKVPDHSALAGLEKLEKPVICAVGLEFRDYPTLISAVQGLDVQVVIAAASPWSKRADTTSGQVIPENVTVSRFTQFDLRTLYHISRFMVMPLYKVNFQAGVTAILEAMAMEKAVICSQTPGQTDILVDGVTGVYVSPGDPQALRFAIVSLLECPQEAERMGRAGRQRIFEALSLDCYTARLNEYVKGTLANR
jgi:glycosyltransferase involved in cell wall biosynthesis